MKKGYIIEEINRILDFELEEGIFKLNPKQRARIFEAKEEYKAGKVLSENEANKQIQEWLTSFQATSSVQNVMVSINYTSSPLTAPTNPSPSPW
ncbi:MAG: hypothetical protein IPJ81_03995 [Chitinophagaceae bacterium]|nr:hypothetical protein [Chitinophagaceae bacterium]